MEFPFFLSFFLFVFPCSTLKDIRYLSRDPDDLRLVDLRRERDDVRYLDADLRGRPEDDLDRLEE